jgi:hypothetical protein
MTQNQSDSTVGAKESKEPKCLLASKLDLKIPHRASGQSKSWNFTSVQQMCWVRSGLANKPTYLDVKIRTFPAEKLGLQEILLQ